MTKKYGFVTMFLLKRQEKTIMQYFDLQHMTVRKILSFQKIDLSAGTELLRARRTNCALSMKCAGRTTYWCGSRQYEANTGNVLFVPNGSEYRFRVEEVGPCLMVEFDTAEDFTSPDIHPISVTNIHSLQTIFERAVNLWMFRKPAYVHRCMAELYNILAFLEEQQNISYQNQHCYSMIRSSLAYLEAHCQDPMLSVNSLAEIAGISEIYFRKIFTALYGTSPARYIRTIRIEKAKTYLLDREMRVTDVAEAVGFSNLYHFSRTFKHMVGVSPTEYVSKIHSEGIL